MKKVFNYKGFDYENFMKKFSLKEFIKQCLTVLPEDTRDLLESVFDFRLCENCGKAFLDGYYDDGRYYCERCLPYSEQNWNELCEEDDENYCWTEWGYGDCSRAVATVYNEAVEELKKDLITVN